MRAVEALMIAGLIGLVALAYIERSSWLPGHSAAAATSAAAAVHLQAAEPGKRKPAPGTQKKHPSLNTSVPQMIPEATIVAIPDDTVAPPAIPDKELTTGTSRTELRQRYGLPTLGLTATREGSLVERYYYVDPSKGNMSVATLRNGKVVSTATVAR